MDRDSLVEAVRLAGVVGSGGAGFPTHVKLQAKGIDTYLVNGAECEPLLEGDRHLMATWAMELVSAADTVAEVLGAKPVFALKEKYSDAAAALRKAGATVATSRDYYPLGDEVILIWEALGRIVPEGRLPLDVGVVVNNVETVFNVYEALQGRPVTHTFVASGGAVARPGLFRAPLGASAAEILKASGGVTIPDPVYVDGGPMMGRYSDDVDFPVTKTTKAVLALPRDSLLARMELMPVKTMLKQARVSCCQCNQCTLACSRYLVGIGIEPHKVMRAMAFEGTRNRGVLQMALLCSECNLCSALHACPMGLSPRRVNQQLKRFFREEGLRPEFPKRDLSPHPLRDYRLVPSSRLKSRLGLERYDRDVTCCEELEVSKVLIPLRQHAGEAALPLVAEGVRVVEGDCIATPREGALGSRIHASIEGVVKSVDYDRIVLERQG
jgi:Na+-translocating ferredoxin:NAD+ oxidoreductase RnfC subunit